MAIPEIWRIYDTFRPLLSNLSQTECNRCKLGVSFNIRKIYNAMCLRKFALPSNNLVNPISFTSVLWNPISTKDECLIMRYFILVSP